MHLPLDEEHAKKFDVDKAVEYFKSVEGLPYGYHNFLFASIDTPDGYTTPMLPRSIFPIIFSILERFEPDLTFNFYTEALNKRLGTTEDKNLTEIVVLAAEKNMRVEDVMAMPEIDSWEYHGYTPRDG